MFGVPALLGSSDGGASGGSSEAGAASSSVPGGGAEESGGGNRWPKQETEALLKIRSEMDFAFRDSSVKAPLWEEVSRKMAEIGYQRSAKKCKEKFENVFKYHKRTKDGRAAKSDGKTYRFFDQLEALDSAPPPLFHPPPPPLRPFATAISLPPQPPSPSATLQPIVPSSAPSPNPVSIAAPVAAMAAPTQPPANFLFDSTSTSSSSSDDDIESRRRRRRGRKRKWKELFERMASEVIRRQEDLHAKFLAALDHRERERAAHEDAARARNSARLAREHDLLVQERAAAAARDAAIIAFLEKLTGPNTNNATPTPPPPPPPPPRANLQSPPPQAQPPKAAQMVLAATPMKIPSDISGAAGESSSRWPKAEVQALIDLRTSMDLKYQENGPKAPLWEEISAAMAKLGYSRSSKRCKEKWENINKYFKKVKDCNKKRPEDSKTCPYFNQLDALYKEKARNDGVPFGHSDSPTAPPIMARPEQQWPLAEEPRRQDSNNDIHEEEEEEEEGGGFEIVANEAADRGGGV